MLFQHRSNRKPTGGLLNRMRKKKKMDLGRDFLPVHLKETKRKTFKTYGGNQKSALLSANTASVLDPHTNKVVQSKIITVKENPANPHFVRMNIITKGAIIETELGLAKVTSRPAQHGVINAVLVKNDKK